MGNFFGELGALHEDTDFLTETPVQLKQIAIKTQFDNLGGDTRKSDYVAAYIQSWEKSHANIITDDEQEEMDQLHSDFVAFMEEIFAAKLGIGFPDIDQKPEEEQNEIFHMAYRFFIRYCRRNFTNLVFYYIFDENNYDEIMDLLSTKSHESVISRDYRKEISDAFAVAILANMQAVIRHVFEQEFTVDEFFDLCEGSEALSELLFMRESMDDFSITGNFVPMYISLVTPELMQDVEIKLKRRILQKYRG